MFAEEDPRPTGLERTDGGIQIRWSDGRVTDWSAESLRRNCPCATCREKRSADDATVTPKKPSLPVLSAAEARPVEIVTMRPAGTYAYQIAFSDGHGSGLFTFEQLHRGDGT